MIIGLSPAKNPIKPFMQDTLNFEKYVKVNHSVINYFSGFDSRPGICQTYFYQRPMDIFTSGKIPMITFYPSTSGMYPTPEDMCEKICAGEFDEYLSDVCLKISNYLTYSKSMIYFRFAHEMNVFSRVYANPEKFIPMWKYVYNFVRSKGLTKELVPFVWCPNNIDLRTPEFEDYFPGNEFVEYLGVDGYNWGGRGAWQSLQEVFTDALTRLNMLSNKPVLICEFGTTAKSGVVYDYAKKLQWISDGFEWLHANQDKYFIKMICYFNVNNGSADIDSAIFEAKNLVFNEALLNYVYNANPAEQYKTLENLKDSYCKGFRLSMDYEEI